MYYIYHIPDYVYKDGSIGKIGCTDNLKVRMKLYGKSTKYEILETHACKYKVSDREIELQKQYGYKVDKRPYWKTAKHIKKSTSKVVCVYDINKNFIKKYKSVRECVRCMNLSEHANIRISNALKSKHKQYLNFYFLRENENIKNIKQHITPTSPKKVTVYKAKTNEYIGQYQSIHDACRELNLVQSNASACLNGKIKTHRGYILKKFPNNLDISK